MVTNVYMPTKFQQVSIRCTSKWPYCEHVWTGRYVRFDFFTGWRPNIFLWRSRLSPSCTSSSTILECSFNTTDGRIQFFHEFCPIFSGVAVWGHCKLLKFTDSKKTLKIGLSSVGKVYIVCALLRNALTCLYGNTTSDVFWL